MTDVKTTGSAKTNQETLPDSMTSKTLKGFLLWAIVLSGYLLFCFNWMVMDNMKGAVGESGWYGSFFGDGYVVPSIVDQAPNWTLTFMRGVGAFLAGWLLCKIGHKYSVTIAISLLAFGGILGPLTGLAATPAAGEANYGMFILFLVLRMTMAVGATTLIVYTQPVIANYFNDGQKSATNLMNAFAFNGGSILAIALLTLNPEIKSYLVSNWIVFTSCVSLIAIVLLVLWVVFADSIATPNDPNDTASYGTVLKEKRTWTLSIMFGLWLTWVVLYLTMVPSYFLNPINKIAVDSVGLATAKQGMWKILFLAGLVVGIPIFKWLSTKDWARKPIIMSVILSGVALTMVSSVIGAYTVHSTGDGAFATDTGFALALFYITSFVTGIFGWGVQGYMLGTTYHYNGATPKKQGIVIGACWGIGYMGETLITILCSFTSDIVESAGASVSANAWVFMTMFIFFSVMTAVMWIFIPETHGKNACEDSIHYAN